MRAMLALVLLAGGCWKTTANPNYCDGSDCNNDASVDLGPDAHEDAKFMCTSSTQCGDAAPECSDAGACFACTADNQCGSDVCNLSTGGCVQCNTQSDCASKGGGACETTSHTCVACVIDSNCNETQICDTGVCVTKNIIYVDQACVDAGTGSSADPFCHMTDAFNAITQPASVRTYIKVAGNGTAYPPIAVPSASNMNVMIVGPGKGAVAGSTAQFLASTTSAFAVTPTGGVMQTVVADGLELIGTTASGGKAGVSCDGMNGTAILTVQDCSIHDGVPGVSSTSCALTLERNLIKNNVGALSVSGGSYIVENNALVDGQQASVPPIQLSVPLNATGNSFAFNTVNKNPAGGGLVGIDCGNTSAQTLYANIVVGNATNGTTQFGPKCVLSSTVGMSGDTNAIMATPTFASDDYHLTGSNPMIVDQLTTGPTIKLDIDDQSRPYNIEYDIGCDEVQ